MVKIKKSFWTISKIVWLSVIAVVLITVGVFGYLYLTGEITFFAYKKYTPIGAPPVLKKSFSYFAVDKTRANAGTGDRITVTAVLKNMKGEKYPEPVGTEVRLIMEGKGCNDTGLDFGGEGEKVYLREIKTPVGTIRLGKQECATRLRADGTAVWHISSVKSGKFTLGRVYVGLGDGRAVARLYDLDGKTPVSILFEEKKIITPTFTPTPKQLLAPPAFAPGVFDISKSKVQFTHVEQIAGPGSSSCTEMQLTLRDSQGKIMPKTSVKVDFDPSLAPSGKEFNNPLFPVPNSSCREGDKLTYAPLWGNSDSSGVVKFYFRPSLLDLQKTGTKELIITVDSLSQTVNISSLFTKQKIAYMASSDGERSLQGQYVPKIEWHVSLATLVKVWLGAKLPTYVEKKDIQICCDPSKNEDFHLRFEPAEVGTYNPYGGILTLGDRKLEVKPYEMKDAELVLEKGKFPCGPDAATRSIPYSKTFYFPITIYEDLGIYGGRIKFDTIVSNYLEGRLLFIYGPCVTLTPGK